MTTPEELSISGPEDILGFIPHSLGYWPSESLVAMTMQGKKLGATLRVDLPPRVTLRGSENFARMIRDYLEADGNADGTLLMFFTNERWNEYSGGQAMLLKALEGGLESRGMPVRDAWCVGDARWRNMYCTDPDCCPFQGRSVDEIRDSRLNAEMVFRGSSVGSSPAVRPDSANGGLLPGNSAVLAAERRWAGNFDLRRSSRPQFDAVLEVWSHFLQAPEPAELPTDVNAFLRASLCIPAWRDAVLVMTAAGQAAAERGAEEFGIFKVRAGRPALRPEGLSELRASSESHLADGPTEASDPRANRAATSREDPGYGDVLLGLSPSLPDWTSFQRLEQVLQKLSLAGAGEAKAAVLTSLAWIEWCRGRGSYADALLNQALEEHQGYRLAELFSELVRRGTICGWARRREAAWQKFEPDAA